MAASATCRICANTQTDCIQNTYVRFDTAEIKLVRCTQCGLVYLWPQPGEDEIKELYSDDYFIKWYSSEEKRAFSKNYFRDLFQKNRLVIDPHCNLLDIGCGMGVFLEVASEWNDHVQGVEISPYAARYCKEQLDLDVHCGTLETAGYPDDSFDIVTTFDVLEHLHSLSGFLGSVRRVLKKEGMFIILVPNYDSLVFQLNRMICHLRRRPLPNIPEHVTYFTIATLKTMLQNHGFEVRTIVTTQANDEGQYLFPKGNLGAALRGALNLFCYQFGKLINREETILAVARARH